MNNGHGLLVPSCRALELLSVEAEHTIFSREAVTVVTEIANHSCVSAIQHSNITNSPVRNLVKMFTPLGTT